MHTFLLHEFNSDRTRILLNSEFSVGINHASVRVLSPGSWPRIKGSDSQHVGSGNVTTSAIKLKSLAEQHQKGMP